MLLLKHNSKCSESHIDHVDTLAYEITCASLKVASATLCQPCGQRMSVIYNGLFYLNFSCGFSRTREDDDVDRNHPEQDAIFQGYQQIQVTDTSPSSLTFSVALMNCAGYSDGMWCRHGDPYLFSDSGMGRKASSGASLKCQQDFIFNVAHFDCTGGEVPLRWTTANTSIHDSFS